ncbi:hypothetical protein CDO73_12620 [Saccharibacillus sp. O23]|uniref:general stress protein n=1 Tax=Saccharibacillus sp. O23 TaxID=2009338 RepID=UPI000B4E760E|nr:general stress protein [Saccharibacillus sp. O23]OWR29918.1 hypothetical protein CDO73_12620 [Saccharibacillus sp. O23]
MAQRVVGVFLTEREAAEVVEDLKKHGFDTENLSVITRNREEADAIIDPVHTKAPEGAAGGAAAGGLLGGVGGLLVGLGALAIPGIGPLLAAGPIAAALAGIAVGATGGGLVGGLIGLGISEDDAKLYDEHVGSGRVLVIVDAEEPRRGEAEELFRSHYALNYTRIGAGSDNDNLTVAPPHSPSSSDPLPSVGESSLSDPNESDKRASDDRIDLPSRAEHDSR